MFKLDYVTLIVGLEKLQSKSYREPRLFAEFLLTPRFREFSAAGGRFIRIEWRGKDIDDADPAALLDVLTLCRRSGGHCSRIDFCADTDAVPNWLELDAATMETCSTPHRWGNERAGFTVGAGNRSRACVRVYDKKRQKRFPDGAEEWTRIELEVHRRPADELFELYIGQPASLARLNRSIIRHILKTMPSVVDFLALAVKSPIEPPGDTGARRHRLTSREWLAENEARIVKSILENPDFFLSVLAASHTDTVTEFAAMLATWCKTRDAKTRGDVGLSRVWASSLLDVANTSSMVLALSDLDARLDGLSRLMSFAHRSELTES